MTKRDKRAGVHLAAALCLFLVATGALCLKISFGDGALPKLTAARAVAQEAPTTQQQRDGLPVADKNPQGRRGASVPFTTYEAEAASTRVHGSKVRMSGLPRGDASTPEMEASGRGYVELAEPGDFVEFPGVRAANALVIRHCIPDAPTGGGILASLSLFVNGKFRQSLTLGSRHNWLYGEAGQNGQSNDPAQGQAHVFWDESRFFIRGGLRRGDTLRLQKGGGDTAAFYHVDLVDLESVPAPLKPPAAGSFLSVADYGANGKDTQDDTEAITKCIAAAKAADKIVWIPAGTYYQSDRFALDGVTVRGAGMWWTAIVGTQEGDSWWGKIGFHLSGNAPKVMDLSIDSAAHTSRSNGGKAFTGGPTNWLIENVWVTHTLAGLWLDGSNGIMRGCRIRSTYADAINLNNGASNNVVENNDVRGAGDDGIAILSEVEQKKPLSSHNIVRFNTVSAVWWGQNGDIAGGTGHVIEDNVFADNAKGGCFALNQPSSFKMNPLSNTLITRNSFVRGGGNYAWQRRGAIWTYSDSTSMSNVLFRDNLIEAPIFSGIHLTGSLPQDLAFENNVINAPGEEAVHINAEVTGSVSLESNTARNLPQPGRALVNESKPPFVVTQQQNSWQ